MTRRVANLENVMTVDPRGIGERRTEKGPDNAGPLNRSGNPRYRFDDVSLVTDLLPLNIGFIVGRFLSVSKAIVEGERRIAMWATPHSAYESLHLWHRDHIGIRNRKASLRRSAPIALNPSS